ncbi:DUF935 domain-containing protein [Trabulsiella odontotermitis]|uniref:Mu-like prophage FluMu protein gp29 n=1 Tax=Trabulsiella odontotermitis TaxID=379893 RepID=A0A0L0GQT4_9ENTR|nr:DUF935 domain-containing protein [Trabulsiella odontotermitis]KNC91111.1 hypothetical protein GM31_02775 [Trabulsiella odontotermitis]
MDIKGVFKRYFSRIKTEPMQSDEDPYLYREFPEHPSTGLDIQRIYTLFQAAEQGDIQAQSDLFTDMEERDGHLFAEMSKRKRALLTLPFSVKAPPDATEAEKKIAAEADWWLHQLPGRREMLMDMLDAIGHGFSCTEIEWGQKGDLTLPVKFHKRAARMFTMPQDDLNQINLRRGGADGEPLWDLGWLVHRHKSKSGPVAQSGLFRVLVWTYLFKNLSARDWAQFLNLYGLPFRIGKYDTSMGDKERSRLLRGIRQLAREGGGIIPKDADIQLIAPSANQSAPFFAMVDWCEKVQSKVILGGTLTSQADGKSSTNALGNIHNEVRHDLLTGDAEMVAETLTQQLLWPVLALNGRFDPARAPWVEFDTREATDLNTLMDVVLKAQGAGFDITAQWLSDKSGIPLPQQGQTILKPVSRQLPGEAALSQVMQARLAALSLPAPSTDEVQSQLDAAPQLLAAQASAAAETMLRPLIDSIRSAQSPDEVYALLAASYPTLNDASLRELVGQAVFAADVLGQHYA